MKFFPWGWEGMELYLASTIGALAFAAGIFFGRGIGIRHEKKTIRDDLEREVALRMNAKYDFENVRAKAEQIVGLANEIGRAAKTAHETVYKSYSASPSAAKHVYDNPGSGHEAPSEPN